MKRLICLLKKCGEKCSNMGHCELHLSVCLSRLEEKHARMLKVFLNESVAQKALTQPKISH